MEEIIHAYMKSIGYEFPKTDEEWDRAEREYEEALKNGDYVYTPIPDPRELFSRC